MASPTDWKSPKTQLKATAEEVDRVCTKLVSFKPKTCCKYRSNCVVYYPLMRLGGGRQLADMSTAVSNSMSYSQVFAHDASTSLHCLGSTVPLSDDWDTQRSNTNALVHMWYYLWITLSDELEKSREITKYLPGSTTRNTQPDLLACFTRLSALFRAVSTWYSQPSNASWFCPSKPSGTYILRVEGDLDRWPPH